MLDTRPITGSSILQVSKRFYYFCSVWKLAKSSHYLPLITFLRDFQTLSHCLTLEQNVAFEFFNVKELAPLAMLNETFSVIFKRCVFLLGMESWWPVIPGFTFWPASSSHVPVRWASSASVGRTISCDFGTQLTRKPVVILLGYGRIILRIYVDTHSSFTLKMFFSPKLSKECTKLDKNYTLLWARKMWLGAKHA